MGGREYLGCLLALAAMCLLAGAPVAWVAGVVFWNLAGGIVILGGLVLVFVALSGGGAAIASLFDRLRSGPPQR